MIRSLIGLPLRFTARGARFAVAGATGVAERALVVAGELADAVTKHTPDLDFDGSAHEPRSPEAEHPPSSQRRPRQRAQPAPPSPSAPPAPPAPPSSSAPPAPPAPPAASALPGAGAPAPDAVAPPQPPEAAPAVPEIEEPRHVSTEPTLVDEVADPGAEDGAGAEVHVAEPWDGYRQMTADDVIDRITGASAAELAAVELYELAGRRRQTVLAAVRTELERSSHGR